MPWMTEIEIASFKIKAKALSLGFDAVGISKARELSEQKSGLQNWLDKKYNAEMHYMNNHFEKRIDPTKLVENSKSVISVIINYKPQFLQTNKSDFKISKYAYGEDYHFIVKKKLQELLSFIDSKIQKTSGRAFVDSAPVLERNWAQLSGLGWIGKNSLLINRNIGSFFFIGELILDLELLYDEPYDENHCGSCTKCIDACPTKAILKDGVIDANKCISFLTIENKNNIPEEFKNKLNDWAFGCDICQDVCPWNNRTNPTKLDEFKAYDEILNFSSEDWLNISETDFNRFFKNSPLKRTKFSGIERNIYFLKRDS